MFPHVYANAYLTPPNSHAVEAHADDRDVLVMQILGRKKWKVYKKVPVEYLFDMEQVGKHGNKVDESVFKGGLCFDGKEVILNPGDVMYLPRGFVYEATTEDSNDDDAGCAPSFHTTVAIATHDWCLSVVLSETIHQTLDGVTKFRKALPIGPCDEYLNSTLGEGASSLGPSNLKQQLDEAMAVIQSNITPSLLEQKLQTKHQIHNAHASEHRSKLQETQQQSRKRTLTEESSNCVGYSAASHELFKIIYKSAAQKNVVVFHWRKNVFLD